jgi:hypothetical protein
VEKLKKKTVFITQQQDGFLKRKAEELRRVLPPGEEDKATESRILQGLLDFWMAFEARRKEKDVSPHKSSDP